MKTDRLATQQSCALDDPDVAGKIDDLFWWNVGCTKIGPDGKAPSVRFAASFPINGEAAYPNCRRRRFPARGVSAHAPMSAEAAEWERATKVALVIALTGAARAARSFAGRNKNLSPTHQTPHNLRPSPTRGRCCCSGDTGWGW